MESGLGAQLCSKGAPPADGQSFLNKIKCNDARTVITFSYENTLSLENVINCQKAKVLMLKRGVVWHRSQGAQFQRTAAKVFLWGSGSQVVSLIWVHSDANTNHSVTGTAV